MTFETSLRCPGCGTTRATNVIGGSGPSPLFGTVAVFDYDKGAGTISPSNGGADIFVALHDVPGACLRIGDVVSFELGIHLDGYPMALNVSGGTGDMEHTGDLLGHVKFFILEKGYGCISSSTTGLPLIEEDIFVHISDVRGNLLIAGDEVTYDSALDFACCGTRKAVNVQGGSGRPLQSPSTFNV